MSNPATATPEAPAAAASNSAPAAPSTSNVPQAQGASVLSKEMADAIAASVAQEVSKARDSIFAEARRTFKVQKQDKAKPTDGESPAPAQTQQLDPIKLRALDRALNRAGIAADLTQSQYERAERAFVAESPDDVNGWVADYFSGWKGSQPQPAPATQSAAAPSAAPAAAPAAPVADRPVSDRGSPPPSQVALEEADLVTMSESDRNALIKQKGTAWYWQKLQSQLKGRPVSLRR